MSTSAAPDRNQQETPPAKGEPLAGRRVLIVEDDPFIAMAVEETLVDFGLTIAGVARNLREAVHLAKVADFDIALLDVNIGHETIDGVAEAVDARGKPFVFTTGHGRAGLPEAYRERAIVEKPFYVDEILNALRAELGLT